MERRNLPQEPPPVTAAEIPLKLLAQVVGRAGEADLLSHGRFTVNGPRIEARASEKSFRGRAMPPLDDPVNPSVTFTAKSVVGRPKCYHDPDAHLAWKNDEPAHGW